MASQSARVTIDQLLNLVPENPDVVLERLASNTHLALQQDSHGYSLLHAATSYGHAHLLKTLVSTYSADVNIRDEDGETPLFAAETVEMARVLLEELHADVNAKSDEGQTAEEAFEANDDSPLVAAYLREFAGGRSTGEAASVIAQTGGAQGAASATNGTLPTNGNGVHPPPLVPNGMDIKIGTMPEAGDTEGEPDPEFRRRIEELASRPDFEGEEGQRELRTLIEDAVSGLSSDQSREVRRRLG